MLFNNKNKDESTNFWISYADLMAGLLFVFILLIGAILIKSIVLKSSLDSKENSLSKSMSQLDLKQQEIEKLKALLLEKTTQLDDFNSKIVILQNLLNESNTTIADQNKTIADFTGQVLVLSNQLTAKDDAMKLSDAKVLQLLAALSAKQTEYDKIVADLQDKKAKIKSLTGIKIQVIAALKKRLGKNVEIDPKSGSLRLSASILFDKGSDDLKDSSKQELNKVFEKYISTLITDKNIKDHIDKIVIEGHTDSDGGYLYNLTLSQKRAFAVMNYLLTTDFTKKNNIEPLLVASGRSYLDPITKNGQEDKYASRRIEIKFTLKNDDAMNEIEKILEAE